MAELRSQAALSQARSLAGQAETLSSGAKLLVARLDGIDPKALQACPLPLSLSTTCILESAVQDCSTVNLGGSGVSLFSSEPL